jgi:hypothetical protein
MACQPASVKFQLRRATSSNWTFVNPILKAGEPGFESDSYKLKIGDGVNTWINLPYSSGKTAVGPTGSVQYTDGQGNFLGDSGFVYTSGVSGNVNLRGDLLPSQDAVYTLGSSGKRWSEVYVGHGTINIAGPVGSTAVGLIGTDDNSIIYTSFGFATPFINIGPEQGVTLNQGNVGGWAVGPTGKAFTKDYDLIAQEKLVGVTFPAGLTGPRYSLIKHPAPETITDASGSYGSTGQVLSSNGSSLLWISPPVGITGPTGPVTSYIFDGGNAQSSYIVGPVFDCGSAN